MTEMWVMFALLSVLAVLFVVTPFLRRERVQRVDHDANAERIAIYEQRCKELDDELSQGRMDTLVHYEAVLEMKRRLLNELAPEQALTSRGDNRIFALTGVAFLLAVSAVFYHWTGNSKQVESWYQAIEKLPEYGERAVMQKGEPLSANELQAFALGLRTKLAAEGDDAVAWMLLGRVAMSINDYEMAMQAFEKALQMTPDSPNVLINYSQVLLIEGSEGNINRAARMLSKVLQHDPGNIDAISLLALIAYERKDWLEAKTAFEVLLASLGQDDPRYAMITERIKEIEGHIASTQPKSAEASKQLVVQVTLAPELVKEVPENAVLFVFAKAVNGPKMPLAVAKLHEFKFPLSVTLDDGLAMMPELKLSQYQQVMVTARISKDESVALQAGELEGEGAQVTLQAGKNVTEVTISRVY
ncbi:c-type cytochrome biogenesis protein CcmI [Pseudoalteromonas fenneropenaei]|uniref:C-type cytochrome biogenesis protein CcmI n=1 Tax=Pseudoalteromonas fenneropenaei TaxID=1737459 RepID=A0ABV7CGP4_9GAMM